MRFVAALVAALLGVLVAPPANAETAEVFGMSAPVVCVTPMAGGTQGWQIGSGIRFWNAAQPYVHLTRRQLGEGCGTLHVGTYYAERTEPLGDLSGRTYYTGWDSARPGLDGSWFYPSATVLFNDRHSTRPSILRDRTFRCWKRMVVAHEFGHALGLPHSDDPESVMREKLVGRCVTSATAGDRAALDAIYALR